MINIHQNGKVYEVIFRYDPNIVQLIKQVPGKQWISSARHWTIPVENLGFLLNQLKGTMYEDQTIIQSDENINRNRELESSTKIPDIDLKDTVFRVKSGATPYPHQLDFMKWSIYRQNHNNMHGFLLCDEQGCAKTAETMNLAIYNRENYGFSRCLIICCVNPAKYHWYEDIIDHSEHEYIPYILGTRKKKNGSIRFDTGTKEKLEDLKTGHVYGDTNNSVLPYFIIMNIEGLRANIGKRYVIADEIIRWCNDGQISMIAVDEIHKNASPSSVQGKQLLRIKKSVKDIMWIPITGTPITSKPTDVYLPLKLVEGHNYSSFWTWCQKFCIYGGFGGHEILAYKNIPYLKSLVESNMIRRLKKDVLANLPPKIYYTEYVENTPYQNTLYNKVAEELICDRDNIITSLNPLARFIRLRQVSSAPELVDKDLDTSNLKEYIKKNAKLKRLIDIIDEILSRDEKVVIFDNWVDPLRMIYRVLRTKYRNTICVYTGTMRDEDREKNKSLFINDPRYRIMLGTIGALGTMHTLTVANNVIFYSEPWTATDKAQAEDRVHRIGTSKSVNIYTLISKGTVDERVHNIIYRKQGISNYIVDNVDIHSNPELFDLLLSDTLKINKSK